MNSPSIILAAMAKAGYVFGLLPAEDKRAGSRQDTRQVDARRDRDHAEAGNRDDEDVTKPDS